MSSRDEGIIDVERRKTDAEYTLGDPTVFPPEFLVWLKRYIEQSGIQLPASSIFGTFQAGSGSVRNLAAGIVIPFAGPTAPPGSLPCNGQSVSRLTYPGLFDAIGTLYGAVDVNSFNVPDYRDRTLYGIGATLANLTDNDGRAMGSRGPSHHHGVSLNTDSKGNHSHNVSGGTDGAGDHGGHAQGLVISGVGAGGGFTAWHDGGFVNAGGHSHGVSGGTDAQGAHTHAVAGNSSGGPGVDTPAYHGILYVITLG